MTPDEYVPPRVAARLVGVSTQTLARDADSGRIPCHRVGRGRRLYRYDDVVRFAIERIVPSELCDAVLAYVPDEEPEPSPLVVCPCCGNDEVAEDLPLCLDCLEGGADPDEWAAWESRGQTD
jgi:excisionase family DNA binding protein